MACNKANLIFHTSRETLDRFTGLASSLNATNEETLSYLLDFHDKAKPEYDGKSVRPRIDASLHTCVAPEIKAKFKQLAADNGMSYNQMLAALLDEHDKCVGCLAERMAAEPEAEPAIEPIPEPVAEPSAIDGDTLMAQLEAALDVIRDVFRKMADTNRQAASGEDEIEALREQLATAEANAEKARASNKKIQDMLARMAAQLD